jgi:DNA-binding IscR family transcriptional regulator
MKNFTKISLIYLKKAMTVIFSKKCELALQAVLYLAHKDEQSLTSALEISEEIGIPKEFTSKILQTLTKSGIVVLAKANPVGFI